MNAQAQALLAQVETRLTDAAALAAQLAALVPDTVVAEVPPPAEPAADDGLGDPPGFYNWLRSNKMLGPKISPAEYQGCKVTLNACAARQHPLAFTAYELATDYHETAHTMQPVDEIGGAAYFIRLYDVNGQRPELAKKMGNTEPGDGIKFHGRGKVQLTWKSNYAKAGKRLGLDLVAHPELAKDPDVAGRILAIGMEEGWFTGKKLSDYLPTNGSPATETQFESARRIINGTDRAELVAGYAADFQQALVAGKWLS
jgi:putative chitinase